LFVLAAIRQVFPSRSDNDVRRCICQKLNNAAKKMKVKSNLNDEKEDESDPEKENASE
jgi:hypothetical protein